MLSKLTNYLYSYETKYKRLMWYVIVILYCSLAVFGGIWMAPWSVKVAMKCYGFTINYKLMCVILSAMSLLVGGFLLLLIYSYYTTSYLVWPWALSSFAVPIVGWIVSFIIAFCVKAVIWLFHLAIGLAFGIIGVIISVFIIAWLIMGDIFDNYE